LRGLCGRTCRHFDFGHKLRRIVQVGRPAGVVSAADVAYLRDVLERGALLEDGDFPIAKRIIESFLARSGVGETDLVVLNGLPRHEGQARGLAELLDVRAVVYLRCSAETVRDRVRLDTGGDRRNRTDDDSEAIRGKLAIFERHTKPLIDYYRRLGSHIVTLQVSSATTPEQMWETLQSVMRG
jgi:adenylate kinase family enzyme